ncbi:MAG TPA: hypothetical protein VGK67_11305 [Myxococcales bacterium]
MTEPVSTPASTSAVDLAALEELARRHAGVATRVVGGRVLLVPATPREAARALAAREKLGDRAGSVLVSLEAFDRIEPPDPVSGTVRAGANASVGEIEASLRGWGLSLGALSPRARNSTLREWLEGPHAGLRPVAGNRLETAASQLTVALRGGGLYVGPPTARAALGPAIDRAFLGLCGQAGIVLEANLRALARPDVQAIVHAAVDRPEDVTALLRAALRAEVPVSEAQVQRKSRGYLVDLLVTSHAFRARRDRTVLEELVAQRGETRTMRRVYERELPFEGELAWERLPFAIAQSGPMGLYRLSRESVVVAADEPVKGAIDFSASPAPLPEAFLGALGAAVLPGLVPEDAS